MAAERFPDNPELSELGDLLAAAIDNGETPTYFTGRKADRMLAALTRLHYNRPDKPQADDLLATLKSIEDIQRMTREQIAPIVLRWLEASRDAWLSDRVAHLLRDEARRMIAAGPMDKILREVAMEAIGLLRDRASETRAPRRG